MFFSCQLIFLELFIHPVAIYPSPKSAESNGFTLQSCTQTAAKCCTVNSFNHNKNLLLVEIGQLLSQKKTQEDFIPSRVFCGDYILRQSCPEQKPFVDVIFSVQIRNLAPHQRLIVDAVSPFLFFLLVAAEILPLVLE